MQQLEIKKLVAECVHKEIERLGGMNVKFLTPEQLCERWQVTMKSLEKWRLQGKPPVFMKVQASKKAHIRYPLHVPNGVLDVEKQWLRNSTTHDEEADVE